MDFYIFDFDYFRQFFSILPLLATKKLMMSASMRQYQEIFCLKLF